MKSFSMLFVLLVGLSGLCYTADNNLDQVKQKLRVGEKFLAEKRVKCDLTTQLRDLKQQYLLAVAGFSTQKVQMLRRFLEEKKAKCELALTVDRLQAENAELKRQLAEARSAQK